MKISPAEKGFLGALAAACVLVAIGWGLSGIIRARVAGLDAAERRELNQTFKSGETAILDSRADEQPLSSGTSYATEFTWKGSMEATVKRSALYRDWKDAQADIGSSREFFAPVEYLDGLEGVLVVDLLVKNLDARSTSAAVEDPYCFNAGNFNVSPRGEIIGLDSYPKDIAELNSTARWYFELKPGQARLIKIAYEVGDGKAFDARDFSLWAGSFESGKYRFKLDVERGDEDGASVSRSS